MSNQRSTVTGVGLGLHFEILDEVLHRLETGSTLEDIAFFEIAPENYMRRGGFVPSALERIAESTPILSHGLTLSVGGLDPYDNAYLAELSAFAKRFRVPFHSDHLCFSSANGRVLHDLLPLPQTLATAKHVAARIQQAQDKIGLPLLIENISRYFVPEPSEMSEAELVREVLTRADIGLLLDINNAYVNAQNEGTEPLDFLRAIPLSRVRCLHIAGHERRDDLDLIIDTHGRDVIDPVLALLTWTIARTGPLPVVLERDHHIPPLDALLEELRRVKRAYDEGLALHVAQLAQTRARSAERVAPIQEEAHDAR